MIHSSTSLPTHAAGCWFYLRGTVVLVDGPKKAPAVCDAVPEDNLGSCNTTCTIPFKAAMPTILCLLKKDDDEKSAALRRKMFHFHKVSTCRFADFERGGDSYANA